MLSKHNYDIFKSNIVIVFENITMRCRYRSISARFLWSHAETLARLTPRSLSPTLPLVNNCLRHPRLHLSFAPPRLSPRRRLSFASLTPLAHSQCSYARSRPRSLWLHGLLSGVSNKKHVDLLFHSYKNITMIFYYKIDFVRSPILFLR